MVHEGDSLSGGVVAANMLRRGMPCKAECFYHANIRSVNYVSPSPATLLVEFYTGPSLVNPNVVRLRIMN